MKKMKGKGKKMPATSLPTRLDAKFMEESNESVKEVANELVDLGEENRALTTNPNYIGRYGAESSIRSIGGPPTIQQTRVITKKYSNPIDTWDRNRVFTSFDSFEAFPIQKFRDAFLVEGIAQNDRHLVFSGVEQLTDLLFAVLSDSLDSSLGQRVRVVDLTGCRNLSDQGVKWMIHCFPDVTRVVLTGCTKLTNRSLAFLSQYGKKIERVDANATGVSVIGPSLTVTVEGCPLISPAKPDVSKTTAQLTVEKDSKMAFKPLNIFRVCVIPLSPLADWDLLSYLNGGVVSPAKLSSPYGYSAVKLKDGTVFNMMQCTESSCLEPWVLADRTIYILCYDAAKGDTGKIVSSLSQIITHVTAKVDSPVFVLVGSSQKAVQSGVLDSLRVVQTRLQKELQVLQNADVLGGLSYQDQCRLTAARKLREDLVGASQRLKVAEVDTSNPKDKDKLLTLLAETCPEINKAFPEYADATGELVSALGTVSNLLLKGVSSTDEAVKSLQSGSWPKALSSHGQIESSLDLAVTLGILTKVTALTSGNYFIKPDWMMGLCNAASSIGQDLTGSDQSQISGVTTLALEKVKPVLKGYDVQDKATLDVLQELGVVTVKGDKGSLHILASLPADPPIPLSHIWGKEKAPGEMEVVYSYSFPHSLSDAVLSRIQGEVIQFYPSCARALWQTGLYIQEAVVDVLVKKDEHSSGTHSISLCGRVVQPPETYSTACSKALEILWRCMEQWKLIIDAILTQLQLYASVQCSAVNPKPDSVVPLVSSHMMKATNGRIRCEKCDIPSPAASFLWNRARLLYPTFTDGNLLKQPNEQTFIIEGSIWRGSAVGKVTCPLNLNPSEDDTLSITVLQALKQDIDAVQFAVSSRSSAEEYSVSFLNGKLTIQGKEIRASKTSSLKAGDTLRFRLSELLDKSGTKTTAAMTVMLNGEAVHTVDTNLPSTSSWQLSCDRTKASGEMILLVAVPLGMGKGTGSAVEVGMRLEARDRKNPLICVATIEKINENGELLIHFDGWTDRYDYWADPRSPDLHPLGYQEFIGHTHRQYRAELQAPKGYSKQFDWGVYLKEVNSLPVPSAFFTEEQREGTPPTEELRALEVSGLAGSAGIGSSVLSSCRFVPNRALCLEQKVERFLSDSAALEKLYATCSFVTKFPCLLPAEFNLQTLSFPAGRSVFDLSKQGVHFLCSGQGMESLHFVNMAGHSLSVETDDLYKLCLLMRYVTLVLSNQESFIPANAEDFCPGIKSLPTAECERRLLGVLRRYLCLCELLHPWGKDFFTSTCSPANIQQMIDKLFKACLTQSNSTLSTNFPGSIEASNQMLKCKTHTAAVCSNQGLTEIPLDHFKGHASLIHKLDFQRNKITTLPSVIAEEFLYLSHLDISDNAVTEIPPSLCTISLESLNISSNKIAKLPESFSKLADSLTFLNVSNNPLQKLPDTITKLTSLEELRADNVGEIGRLEGIENMTKLRVLSLGHNLLTHQIPEGFGKVNLKELSFPGLPWFTGYDSPKSTLSFEAFSDFLNRNNVMAKLDKQKVFSEMDKDGKGHLTNSEVAELNNFLLAKYPRFGDKTQAPTKSMKCCEGGLPQVLLSLTKLQSLDLSFHRLQSIPAALGTSLTQLRNLRLSDNPVLETLAAEVGGLPLKELHIKGCGQIKTPPKEIIKRGFGAVFGYLKRLMMGSVSCRRTKLMVVGLGGAGKTSLIKALTHRRFIDERDYDDMYELMAETITDGIDITNWKVKVGSSEGQSQSTEPLEFSVWDFAGQTVYYNTHQFFLSTRAVYLLLWNIRLGYEHAGLDFWLSSIACHAPGAPVLVVGTHCDKVEKTKMPTDELQRRFPQIKSFHSVSSFSLKGIPELQNRLIELTLQEKYMGEQIPEAWLTMEQHIKQKTKNKVELLPLKDIEVIAHECGIFDQVELIQAVEFLHDLGSVQFFNTEFLRSYVVINPQWIVDVMTCVVSVHEGAIKDGKFAHADMSRVWAAYPTEMHEWLLRLTEEFDLTFPLHQEAANLVPCLLPDKEPQYDWPELDPSRGHRETKMMYRFRYLPAGLFNRTQVRLHQFSDSSVIWKKGSLLKKNNHVALILQVGYDELLLKVRGPRPQNILYLVHEVVECLIAESFYGVQYDFSVPCHDCLDMLSLDPCMFSSSKVQRAVELTVPFLQCDKYFHTQSVKDLQATIPASGTSDLDLHLGKTINDLQNLHEELVLRVYFSYCPQNAPVFVGDDRTVHPDTIAADLRKAGMKVTTPDPSGDNDLSKLTMVLKESDVIVVGMSDEYVEDKACTELLVFARDTLRKTVILVVLGSGFKWRKSPVGILCANDVYVNMQQANKYDTKIKELIQGLRQRTEKNEIKDYPSCFVSYCWSNSRRAMGPDGKACSGALGFGDPREAKDFLEKNGVSCWLDVEQVGKAGLYEDIADGLRRAKVIVAFVSDQYAESKNCQMEFRYAVTTLKIPTIIVVVGTGYKWERTEVGMLSVGYDCPKVNYQFDNPMALEELLAEVKQLLPKQESNSQGKQLEKKEQEVAFQEELELAQRKFFRYIVGFAEAMDTAPYPRLIVLDLIPASQLMTQAKPSATQTTNVEDTQQEEKSGQVKESTGGSVEMDVPTQTSKYCFTLLCECEEGWHDVSPSLPLPAMSAQEEESFLRDVAGYMARLLAILKNTTLSLACLTAAEGEPYRHHLDQLCMKQMTELQDSYVTIRRHAMELDTESSMGNLRRCHLSNGKTAWLCAAHQSQSHAVQNDQKPIQPMDELSANQMVLQRDAAEADTEHQQLRPPLRALNHHKPGGDNLRVDRKKTTSRACSVM